MKNNIILLMMIALFNKTAAQSHVGLEQYYYFGSKQEASLVSIAYYQSAHNWYGEMRYNYEEKKTVSLYAGKAFDGKLNQLFYTVTPMIGLLLGQFNGGSFGFNLNLALQKIELSSQIQYVFSKNDKEKDFVLNWSELSYQLLPFMKSGLVIQQTSVTIEDLKIDAGFFAGFSYKNWGLPIYIFSPLTNNRNYVIGINWEWEHKGKNKAPNPSLKGRRQMVIE